MNGFILALVAQLPPQLVSPADDGSIPWPRTPAAPTQQTPAAARGPDAAPARSRRPAPPQRTPAACGFRAQRKVPQRRPTRGSAAPTAPRPDAAVNLNLNLPRFR